MLGVPKALLSLFFVLLSKPEFRRLATSLDYLQVVSYKDRDDLLIVLGHNEKPCNDNEKPSDENLSLNFLLTLYKMAPEGILGGFDGGSTLTFFVDEESKKKAKEVFK